ncbi:MAG: ATP-binding cassette domain-containing protein [Clostridiales bacterium]|nr:ATP-binding cassette domain-containing protein [Clostridiales bacterium]
MEEQELNNEIESVSSASENENQNDEPTTIAEQTQSEFILEVKDLKKFFLTKKEWKIVKEPVEPQEQESEAVEGNAEISDKENVGEQAEQEAFEGENDKDVNNAENNEEQSEKPSQEKKKFKYRLVRQKTYVRAVSGVSFNMKCGETLGIVGESGCGKSTMGRSILRLHPITDGSVFFEGTDITKLKPSEMRKFRTKMQIIFQDPYSSLPPRSPVGQIIGEAVKVHKIVPKSDYRDYVIDIMRKCGLQDFYYDRYPHEFSGGQRQRICIARALAVKPKFVVCDEPVSALDVSIQAQVINLLKDLQRDMNLTYLFISHDLSVVQHISDRVGVMYLGSFVELGDKKDIFDSPMHPYTHALLSAVPVPDPHYKGNRIILHGDIPSPAHPPKGCKFHTRCSRCMEICKSVEPKFKDYGNGHMCACHLYPQD